MLSLSPPHGAWGEPEMDSRDQRDIQKLVDTSDKMTLTGGVEEASGPKEFWRKSIKKKKRI